MAVVTISREMGAGGSELARQAAELLGYEVVDKEIITEVARIARVSESEVEQFDERAISAVKQFLLALIGAEAWSRSPVAPTAYAWHVDFPQPIFHPTSPEGRETEETTAYLDRREYIKATQSLIQHLWRRDNVIIVGRGSQIILSGLEDVLHVRLVAPADVRVARISAAGDIDTDSATQLVQRTDRRRAAYLRQSYGRDWNDPMLYHMVLNTGALSIAAAAETTAEAVRQLSAEHPRQPEWEPRDME